MRASPTFRAGLTGGRTDERCHPAPGRASGRSDPEHAREAERHELTTGFAAALAEIQADASVRVLILTGSGPAFCAGGDLADLQAQLDAPPEWNRRHMGEFYRVYLGLLRLEIPTVAAINGAAIGAGLSIALACDMRVAAAGARLGATFLNLGLHPGMGTTHLLPALIGSARAAELLFTGKVITAQEALSMGLLNRVVPGADLLESVRADAAAIASKPAEALRLTKRALIRAKLEGLEAALDYEAMAQSLSFASAEMRAAVAALRSQRSGS